MEYIKIVNLEKYQHYQTNRENVWIKWYFKSLNSYEFCQLTDAERWLFVGLVMLGVQSHNKTPFDALHIRNKVLQVQGRGVSKCRAGCLKMAKLGLIRIENDSTDKNKIREDKIREDGSSLNNEPTSLTEAYKQFLKGNEKVDITS